MVRPPAAEARGHRQRANNARRHRNSIRDGARSSLRECDKFPSTPSSPQRSAPQHASPFSLLPRSPHSQCIRSSTIPPAATSSTTRRHSRNNTNPALTPALTPATGSGNLIVDGPASPAGTGLYSIAGDWRITISQDAGDLPDVTTVLIQIDAAPAGPLIPVLTFSCPGRHTGPSILHLPESQTRTTGALQTRS